MASELFLVSVRALIRDLAERARNVRASLDHLQHQDSSYAQDHRALLAAYEEALAVLQRHRDEAVNPGPAVLEDRAGPPCPVCCRPSWPMAGNGRLWRCSGPGCPVSSFVMTDHLPLGSWEVRDALAPGQAVDHLGAPVKVAPPLSYDLGTHKVLSMAGLQQLASEVFPEGVPTRAAFDLPSLLPPEDPSHG